LAAATIVFAAIMFFAVQIVLAQRAHREAADKGPRATGLIELAPNGKAHLIPIVIMVDGKFYDAAEYKASPVPMSLESGTTYEAFRSGVSQGLFTVRTAQTGAHTWRGDGTWQSAADIQAAAEKKKATAAAKAKAAKKNEDDQEGPPKLRRAASKPSDSDSSKSPTPPATVGSPASPSASGTKPASNPPGGSGSSTPQSGTAASSPTSASAAQPPEPSSPEPSSTSDENDPDRPRLRRGAGPPEARNRLAVPAPTVAKASTPAPAKAGASSGVQSPNIQLIPAVSDAGGPEPRPYTFNMKPDEERELRTKMLALAAAEVNARDKVLVPTTTAKTLPSSSHKTKAVKAPQPTFADVQFHVFDLSNSNEPVLIMTARAKMPVSLGADNSRPSDGYLLTLVAREDIYGDLHKALSNVTDNQHLDVLPRLDLIDAVDVDGDGGGELLFRRVSDTGSGYVVYRVIGNQLWPLYEGPIG